jgi:hypothetical protein
MVYRVIDRFDAYTYDGVTWYTREASMEARKTMHIELRKGKSKNPFNRYYLVIVENNKDLQNSEMYYSKWNAKRAARKNFDWLELIDTTKKPYKSFGASK